MTRSRSGMSFSMSSRKRSCRKAGGEREANSRGDAEGRRRRGGKPSDNSDNSRQFLRRQLKQPGTTLSRCAAQPGGACQRKGPSNCHLGGATFQSRPSEWVCGREEKDKPDKGERPAGAVPSDKWAVRPAGGPLRERQTGEQGKREGSERKTHAEPRRSGDAEGKNPQTIPTIPDNYLRRQLKQLGTTLSRCRADNSARRQGANGIEGGKKKTNKQRGTRESGEKREGGLTRRRGREKGGETI